jgi:hypothetical protein
MSGATSVVEVEAETTHKQETQIVDQLNRQGVTTEVIPIVGIHP